MEEIMKVKGLNKTFTLSQKQQKIEKTNEKKRIAVHDLSFTSYRGEVFGLLRTKRSRKDNHTPYAGNTD